MVPYVQEPEICKLHNECIPQYLYFWLKNTPGPGVSFAFTEVGNVEDGPFSLLLPALTAMSLT